MKDFGAVMRGLGANAMEMVFAAEWIKLDREGSKLVLQDFLEASEDGMTANEYKRNIGKGNLASYAECMKVRARKGW